MYFGRVLRCHCIFEIFSWHCCWTEKQILWSLDHLRDYWWTPPLTACLTSIAFLLKVCTRAFTGEVVLKARWSFDLPWTIYRLDLDQTLESALWGALELPRTNPLGRLTVPRGPLMPISPQHCRLQSEDTRGSEQALELRTDTHDEWILQQDSWSDWHENLKWQGQPWVWWERLDI